MPKILYKLHTTPRIGEHYVKHCTHDDPREVWKDGVDWLKHRSLTGMRYDVMLCDEACDRVVDRTVVEMSDIPCPSDWSCTEPFLRRAAESLSK